MAFSQKSSVPDSLLPPGGYRKIPLLTPDQTDATISALILIPAHMNNRNTSTNTHQLEIRLCAKPNTKHYKLK